jgi:hypothetical protein
MSTSRSSGLVLLVLVSLAILVSLVNIIGHQVLFFNSGGGMLMYSPMTISLVDDNSNNIVPPKPRDIHANNNENDDKVVIIHDGELLTRILLGQAPYPINSRSIKYKPGLLHLNHATALQHCYINTTIYAGHISPTPQSLVSLSTKYKLIYRNNPKSSSSSARHAMQDYFHGQDKRMKHDELEHRVHTLNYTMVSFIRDPLNRFYSSYDEAYFRMGPWMGSGPIVDDKPRVKAQYYDNKWKMDVYPYLYTNMSSIDDYRSYYCPSTILQQGRYFDCNTVPSIDTGELLGRFTKFVTDYNGTYPFDIHLNLQVSNFIYPNGSPMPLTRIYNSNETEAGWVHIGNTVGVSHIPIDEMTHGRKISRRFNISDVSRNTKRKICHLMALDYCCLNIQLPIECDNNDDADNDDDTVYCTMEQRHETNMEYALTSLVIYPWQDTQQTTID